MSWGNEDTRANLAQHVHFFADSDCSRAAQEKKRDAGKLLLFSVPTEMVQAVGHVMTFGAAKYGRDTWKDVEADRYRQAMARHFEAYKANPGGVDEESGLPHLWHLACNVAFLCHKHGEVGE